MSSTLTVRIDEKTKDRLERLARSLDRSKSYIVSNAIEEFLDLNEWQIGEIKAGIKEAEAGRLVEHEKVARKWRSRVARPVD